MSSIIEITNMSELSQQILDVWLKFGTAFIVYRIGMFYTTNQTGEVFDETFLEILLFTLIGFSLYYVLVKPFITDKIEHPLMRGVTHDFLFLGGGIFVAQFLYDYVNERTMTNKEMEMIGYLLVSVAVYRILVQPFVPIVGDGRQQLAMSDIVKYGSILIVYQLVSTMDVMSITNSTWLMSLGFAMLGFLVYHYGTSKLISNKQISQ